MRKIAKKRAEGQPKINMKITAKNVAAHAGLLPVLRFMEKRHVSNLLKGMALSVDEKLVDLTMSV
jgi:hypothetical protein